jgi:hypothetical protein
MATPRLDIRPPGRRWGRVVARRVPLPEERIYERQHP